QPPRTPPIGGATIGIHHQPLPARNTSLPHPAIAVNRRGPKSRAGLIAYPALKPNVAPISTTSRPTMTGARPDGAGELRLSASASVTAGFKCAPVTPADT